VDDEPRVPLIVTTLFSVGVQAVASRPVLTPINADAGRYDDEGTPYQMLSLS
jgi:hypothetical protein